MEISIDTRFFRAGVGTVIYNSQGEVAFFERAQHPVGVWQFQQGGIDLGEDEEVTLWRELKEEVGLTQDDFDSVDKYPKWTVYQYDHTLGDASKSRIGQAHRWYYLKLKDTATIDLTMATEFEASDFKWISFDEVLDTTNDFKKHVYSELSTYFSENILRN